MSRRHKQTGYSTRRGRAFRRRVLERDRWRCTSCGAARVLEAHHIVPIEDGGDPWDMDNAATLCRGCHIAHHQAERKSNNPTRDRWQQLVAERLGTL